MIRRSAMSPPSLAVAVTALLLAGSGVCAAPVAAQDISTSPGAPTAFSIGHRDPIYGAWDDQSGDLPGTETSTALLIAAGVVAVAAVAYYVFRSDDGEDEDQGERSATDGREPDRRVPTLYIDVDRRGSATTRPSRWSLGVAWRF